MNSRSSDIDIPTRGMAAWYPNKISGRHITSEISPRKLQELLEPYQWLKRQSDFEENTLWNIRDKGFDRSNLAYSQFFTLKGFVPRRSEVDDAHSIKGEQICVWLVHNSLFHVSCKVCICITKFAQCHLLDKWRILDADSSSETLSNSLVITN